MEAQTTRPATQIDDPLDSAMAAEARPAGPRAYFGQITYDVWYCILAKGGKVPFDAGQHGVDQRRTSIDLILMPLARPGRQEYKIERSMIAESKEWASIVKPSLAALGTDLRSLKDRWVQVTMVPTGRTYQSTDRNTGQVTTKDATTLKFIALYASEDECRAAADAHFAHSNGGTSNTAAPAPASAPATNDAERQTAAKFLPTLWKAARNNVTEFERLIGKTEPVNKYFDISSPEVLALITA